MDLRFQANWEGKKSLRDGEEVGDERGGDGVRLDCSRRPELRKERQWPHMTGVDQIDRAKGSCVNQHSRSCAIEMYADSQADVL